jgi:hypothetical protein
MIDVMFRGLGALLDSLAPVLDRNTSTIAWTFAARIVAHRLGGVVVSIGSVPQPRRQP